MLKRLIQNHFEWYDGIKNTHLRCLAMVLLLSPGFILMGLGGDTNPALYAYGFAYVCLYGCIRIIYTTWLMEKKNGN